MARVVLHGTGGKSRLAETDMTYALLYKLNSLLVLAHSSERTEFFSCFCACEEHSEWAKNGVDGKAYI